MAYCGLLMEFRESKEHFMYSWDIFKEIKESKKHMFADSINFIAFWSLQEPELENIQNDFVKIILCMFCEDSEFISDIFKLKELFINFYIKDGKEIEEIIKSTFGPLEFEMSKDSILHQEFIKYLKKKEKKSYIKHKKKN